MMLVVQHPDLIPIHRLVYPPGVLCQCRGGCLSWLHRPPVLTQPLVETSASLPHVCGRTSSTGDLVDNTRQFSLGGTILWSHQNVSECCMWIEGDLDTQWGEDVKHLLWHPLHIGQCDHWALCVISIHCPGAGLYWVVVYQSVNLGVTIGGEGLPEVFHLFILDQHWGVDGL